MPESVLDLGLQRGRLTSKQVFAVSVKMHARWWEFGLWGQTDLVSASTAEHQSPAFPLTALAIVFLYFFLVPPHLSPTPLKQRRAPRLQAPLFHLYSLPRWSRALDTISMLWLSFVLWSLRNSLPMAWPVLKPQTHKSNSYLPSPLGCLLALSHWKAPKLDPDLLPWLSLLLPVLPSQLLATPSF